MSLAKKVIDELTRLAVDAAGQSAQLQFDSLSGRLDCELATVDRLACAVNRICLHSKATSDWDAQQLSQLCDDLAKQLCYLLEPIATIEIDRDSATLQMRSTPPSADEDNNRCYYELVARPGQLSLVRFIKQPSQPRSLVSMQLTHEVVAKLAEDFASSIRQAT